MEKKVLLAVIGLALFFDAAAADKTDVQLDTMEQRFSYAVGAGFAKRLKAQGLDVDAAAFVQAISDVLAGRELRLSSDEMRAAADAYEEKQRKEEAALGEENLRAGRAFLAKNKDKDGVVETESGLQYRVIRAGTGKKPKATDTVVVDYRGTLIDGTEFDSSYKRGEPATFTVNGVIKGWQEALQLMAEGAKWQIVVPPELAYGANGAGPKIGPNAVLIFDVELQSIK